MLLAITIYWTQFSWLCLPNTTTILCFHLFWLYKVLTVNPTSTESLELQHLKLIRGGLESSNLLTLRQLGFAYYRFQVNRVYEPIDKNIIIIFSFLFCCHSALHFYLHMLNHIFTCRNKRIMLVPTHNSVRFWIYQTTIFCGGIVFVFYLLIMFIALLFINISGQYFLVVCLIGLHINANSNAFLLE